jgi:phosphoribosyl-dephospho-CoA transferase
VHPKIAGLLHGSTKGIIFSLEQQHPVETMASIDVDFDVYRELTSRRTSEEISYNCLLFQTTVAS